MRTRGVHWAAALLGALVAPLVPARAAAAANVPLPPGIHLGPGGRYYQDVCDHGAPYHCFLRRRLPASFRPETYDGKAPLVEPETSPINGAMTPSDVLAGYQVPAPSAAGGKIVAVIDMPDSGAYGDLSAYRQAFGLPALPQCSGGLPDGKTPCFAQVDESGSPASSPQDGGGMYDIETALDMQMISAACPDCSILLVGMTGALASGGITIQDFTASVPVAAKLGAVAISMSFGGPENGGDPTGFTTPGHLALAASGDQGYLLGGSTPSYPASAPDVLAVGGTTLDNAGGSYSETVWNDQPQGGGADGSGCSTEFPMPAFQKQFGTSRFGPCTQRASVDVAAAAEFGESGQEGGIAVYASSGGGWTTVTGTSAACPLVAGILTRLGLTEAISSDLGFVYTNIADFNDVTSGSNGSCGSIMCQAGPGWDGPTGVGTPNGSKLQALGSGSSSGSGSGSGGASSGSGGTDAGIDAPASGGTPDAGSGSSGSAGGGDGGAVAPPPSEDDAGAPVASGGNGAAGPDVAGDLNAPGGCGCETIRARASSEAWIPILGLLAEAARRRRRVRRTRVTAGGGPGRGW